MWWDDSEIPSSENFEKKKIQRCPKLTMLLLKVRILSLVNTNPGAAKQLVLLLLVEFLGFINGAC